MDGVTIWVSRLGIYGDEKMTAADDLRGSSKVICCLFPQAYKQLLNSLRDIQRERKLEHNYVISKFPIVKHNFATERSDSLLPLSSVFVPIPTNLQEKRMQVDGPLPLFTVTKFDIYRVCC